MSALRLMVAGAMLAAGLAPLHSHAVPSGCGVIQRPNGEFVVAKLLPVGGSASLSISWSQKDPVPPTVDDDTYSTSLVVYVISGGGGVRAYILDVGGSGAPRVVARANGQTLVEESVPTFWRTGVHGSLEAYNAGGIDGTTYLIAYGIGPRDGLLSATGPGRWTIDVYTSGATCEILDVPGEIVDYNQTHFQGPTNVYVPSIGIGQDLSLDVPVTRDLAAGFMFAATRTGGLADKADLRYGSLRVGSVSGQRLEPWIVSRGTKHFALDYYGADIIAQVNFLQFDLP